LIEGHQTTTMMHGERKQIRVSELSRAVNATYINQLVVE
jgi:hypothetical protein